MTLKNILLGELDFEEITTEKQALKLNVFCEYQLKDALIRVPYRPFKNSMKLTTLNHLEQAAKFSEFKQVDDNVLV